MCFIETLVSYHLGKQLTASGSQLHFGITKSDMQYYSALRLKLRGIWSGIFLSGWPCSLPPKCRSIRISFRLGGLRSAIPFFFFFFFGGGGGGGGAQALVLLASGKSFVALSPPTLKLLPPPSYDIVRGGSGN